MDLWKINDTSEQVATTTPGAQGQGKHKRSPQRPTERTMGSLVRVWLQLDYIPTYCVLLAASRIFRRCYLIDALGTPGANQTNHQPGLTLQHTINQRTQQLLTEQAPITLHSFLLTGSESKRKATQSSSTPEKKPSAAHTDEIIHAPWLAVAPEILHTIEQSPAIFLLNPLTPRLFTHDDLQALFQRTVSSEYGLLLFHKQIEQCLQLANKRPEQATALTALLRSDRWKGLDPSKAKGINGFVTLFVKAIQRHFPWSPQQISLTMQNGPASVAPLPMTLIFATRRPDSLLGMNDAFCRYQRSTVQASFKGVLSEEWFVEQEQQRQSSALQQLAQQLQQQGRLRKIRRWPELRQYSLLHAFGQFTQAEYDTCIQQLIAQKQVHCLWHQLPQQQRQQQPATEQQSQSEQESRVPGNEDTLIWDVSGGDRKRTR